MEIEQSRQGNITVIRLIGDLELTGCREVDHRLRETLGEANGKVVIDLKETRYIDSSGLGILVSLYSHIRKSGGQLVLANPNRSVRRLFDLTNVQNMLRVYGTVEEALGSLQEGESHPL